MPIHDISVSITESLAVWPGDPRTCITQPLHLRHGDAATVSCLHLGAHTGTHVDAPAHFICGGSTIDALSLDVLVGPAEVVDALAAGALSASTLAGLEIPSDADRLIFHTQNSARWEQCGCHEDYVSITLDGAEWLTDRGIRLTGVDLLVRGPSQPPWTYPQGAAPSQHHAGGRSRPAWNRARHLPAGVSASEDRGRRGFSCVGHSH